MKARIVKYGFYYGQIWRKGRWESVTLRCLTKIGCKHELKKWIRDNYPEEFEI